MVLIIVFSMLSACKTKEVAKIVSFKPSEEKREEIKIPLENLQSFNPYVEKNPSNLKVLNLIYEPLFRYDEKMKACPVLAEGYEITDLGKKITVKLKDGVKWHNGDELSSNDVIYTINMILQTDSLYSEGVIEKAEIQDNKTVTITFIKPQAFPLEKLMFPIIKSDEIIGTGPFKFTGKKSVDTFGFQYFEDYREREGETRLIHMINCPDKKATERLFDIGEADVLMSYTGFSSNDDIKVYESVKNELLYIGVNFNNSVFWGENSRKALLYIPDKKEIAEKVMYKRAVRADFPINPESFLYPFDLECQKDNILAQELLLKDSWTRLDGVFSRITDNTLQKFSINMLVKENDEMKLISEALEKSFDNFGIECNCFVISEAEFNENIKNYDIFIDKITLSDSADFGSLTDEENIFGYLNSDLEKLKEEMRTAKNEEELSSLCREASSVLLKDVQFIPLFFYKDLLAARSYVAEDVISTLMMRG